jgi:hypothetical protein
MKRFWAVALGVFAPAAFLAANSGAVTHAPSGDTCSVTGSGTSYTLVINLPENAAEQGSFAFGAPGAKVMNINAPGTGGALATDNLPANTSAAWHLTAALVPGQSLTASLATSAPVTGSFRVVPGDARHTTWYDAVVCAVAKVPVVSNKFTVHKPFAYNRASGTWRGTVTVPGPGRVIYNHRTLATGGTPSPLVWSGKVTTWKAGTVAITLKPTPAGRTMLARSGAIKLSLTVQFSPKNGKPASKLMTLALRK